MKFCHLCKKEIKKGYRKIYENIFCSSSCISKWSKNNVDIENYSGTLKKCKCKSCGVKYLSCINQPFCSKNCNCNYKKKIKNTNCKNCSILLETKVYKCHGYNYCSNSCIEQWSNKNINPDEYKGKLNYYICGVCENGFFSYVKDRKTCSKQCYSIWMSKDKIVLQCDQCLKSFERYPSSVFWSEQRNNKKTFCSVECRANHYSKENNPNWISDRNQLKDRNKSIRWSTEMCDWRKSVYERDNYSCVICNIRGTELNAHHIKRFCEYPELRFCVDNGITLCEEHHKSTYKKEYLFEDLFNKIIADIKAECRSENYRTLFTEIVLGKYKK